MVSTAGAVRPPPYGSVRAEGERGRGRAAGARARGGGLGVRGSAACPRRGCAGLRFLFLQFFAVLFGGGGLDLAGSTRGARAAVKASAGRVAARAGLRLHRPPLRAGAELVALLGGLVDEGLVDVGDDTTARDGGLDEGVELLVTTDGELKVAGGDALDLRCLGREGFRRQRWCRMTCVGCVVD